MPLLGEPADLCQGVGQRLVLADQRPHPAERVGERTGLQRVAQAARSPAPSAWVAVSEALTRSTVAANSSSRSGQLVDLRGDGLQPAGKVVDRPAVAFDPAGEVGQPVLAQRRGSLRLAVVRSSSRLLRLCDSSASSPRRVATSSAACPAAAPAPAPPFPHQPFQLAHALPQVGQVRRFGRPGPPPRRRRPGPRPGPGGPARPAAGRQPAARAPPPDRPDRPQAAGAPAWDWSAPFQRVGSGLHRGHAVRRDRQAGRWPGIGEPQRGAAGQHRQPAVPPGDAAAGLGRQLVGRCGRGALRRPVVSLPFALSPSPPPGRPGGLRLGGDGRGHPRAGRPSRASPRGHAGRVRRRLGGRHGPSPFARRPLGCRTAAALGGPKPARPRPRSPRRPTPRDRGRCHGAFRRGADLLLASRRDCGRASSKPLDRGHRRAPGFGRHRPDTPNASTTWAAASACPVAGRIVASAPAPSPGSACGSRPGPGAGEGPPSAPAADPTSPAGRPDAAPGAPASAGLPAGVVAGGAAGFGLVVAMRSCALISRMTGEGGAVEGRDPRPADPVAPRSGCRPSPRGPAARRVRAEAGGGEGVPAGPSGPLHVRA